jgi:HEPN domain-containing protein
MLVNAPISPDWEPIPGGTPTLELYVDAADLGEAQQKAEAIYAKMRKEGGLSPQPKPRVVGLLDVTGKDPLWLQHFDEAADMLEQQRYELAIITAQIACETEIKAAIEEAADVPEGSLARMAIEVPRSYSLLDARAQKVFKALLDQTPSDQEFWSEYQDHVRRRNNIVHRGYRVTRPEAAASVNVAEEMVDWVQRIRGN